MAVGNRFKPGHFQYRVVVFDVCPSGFRYISRTPDLRPGRRAYSRDAADDLAAMHAAASGRRTLGPFTSKGEVQIANPNSSGTAYTTLATIVQLLGEEAGFDYLKALHKNVNQYTKSGSAPIKAAARGETTIGIVFLHDAVKQAVQGFPIVSVAPCEGTGYEIGSMSIIKNARNMESAKMFYDWALGEASQGLMPQAKAYQVPSNAAVAPPPEAPKVSEIKLIDYDFAKYGSSAERKRLLAKWDAEVKSLPQ